MNHMRTTTKLSAISAAALLGISSLALAQGGGQGMSPGSSGGAPAGNTMQRMDAPSSGATSPSTQNQPAPGGSGMSGDRMSPRAQGENMGKNGEKSNQAQERMPNGSKQQMGSDTKSDSKSGSTVGAAPSGSVNLTTQQRTMMRERVLTSKAPRVSHVNFAIHVGTVVPSSVRVVEVPPTIVEIRPEWRGYRYFVHNDEIIIVEPRSLKIVAVLDV
jgi:hypothetical protein